MMEMIEEKYNSKLISRDSDTLEITVNGQPEAYKFLKTYEFSSDRKMMSITV